MTERVARYGPKEIALRQRVDRFSTFMSAARYQVKEPGLPQTVIKETYPAILSALAGMDKVRDTAKRFHRQMTEDALAENEREAEIMELWLDACENVLRPAMERAAA